MNVFIKVLITATVSTLGELLPRWFDAQMNGRLENVGVPDQKWETASTVLDTAENAGYGRSRSRLQHWHQEGVISRPVVRNRVGTRGRETHYPGGTAKQYVRALEIHRTVKLLDRVRWLLWFEGWPIELTFVRRRIEAFAGAFDEGVSKMLTPDGQYGDEFEDYLNEVGTRDFDSPALKAVRRRVGAQDFDYFVELMLVRLSGSRKLTDDEQVFLDHAVGDDSARSEKFFGGAPIKEGYEDDDWSQFEEYYKGRSLRDDVANLSDDDLFNVREVVRRLLTISSDVGSTLKALGQPWAGGLSFHSSFAKSFNTDADHQTLLVTCLAVTLSKPSERYWSDLFLQVPAEWSEPEHRRWKFLQRLGTEIPDFDFLLDAKRFRRTLIDPKEKSKLREEFLFVRENNRAEYERVAKRYQEETGLEMVVSHDLGDNEEVPK